MAGRLKWRLMLAGFAVALGSGAHAQAVAPDGRTAYEAAYFAQFAPSTALQIVQRVPGFTLDIGNVDVRGFSQAAGNVVINGQRPSSKSDTLDIILSRIPASRVARVEVGPGDLFGSEYSGKPQVLNLVLGSEGGLAGTIEGSVRRSFTGGIFPQGSVSALLKQGNSTFNASAGINNNQTSEEGFDRLIDLTDDNLLEYRRKTNIIHDPNAFVSASWEYVGGENRTAHLNGRFAADRFYLAQSNDVFPKAGAIRDDRLTQKFHTDEYELGGDVTRPLFGGGIKLIGLATRRHRDNRELSLNRIEDEVIGGIRNDLADQRDETLARIVWSRSGLGAWSIEAGGEGVINRLKSDVDLLEIEGDGSEVPIDLPIAHATVLEHRGELFVNAGRPLTRTLRMDLGLTYEASELTVSGDADAKRVLKFLKSKASFDWQPKPKWHAQLSIARTVAQLQFEDFVSNAQLSTGQVNGGNADLVPQRAWEFLGTVEHNILGDGLVKVELGYTLVSQVQDRVPTPDGLDAPGNLGDGREIIFRTTVDAPLQRFGIKGGRFTAHTSLVSTSVEDPYTHRDRRFSGNSLLLWDANFRQDLGSFAWGFGLSGNTISTVYRLDETDSNYSAQPYVTAFAEYRPNAKTTVTFGVDNLTDLPGYRARYFYAPDRRTPDPFEFEHRHRNQHIMPYLSFKRSFG